MDVLEKIEMVYYPKDAVLAPRADGDTLLGAIGKARERSAVQLADDKEGLETGVWKLQGAVEGVVETDRHIFMFIQSGVVNLTGPDGTSHDFGPVEAFVIPKGAGVNWKQAGDVQAAYYTFLDAAPANPNAGFVRIDPDAPRLPTGQTPALDFFLSAPPPSQNGNEHFSDSTGFWKAGVWDSTPYSRRVLPFPRHEFIHLLDGKAIIRAQDGRNYEFGAGDTFLVPYKLVSDWEVSVAVRKFYCFFTGR